MARGGKKGPTSTLAALEAEAPLGVSAPAGDLMPSPENRAPALRERASIPRTTTDNPWHDLHPTRVWPD